MTIYQEEFEAALPDLARVTEEKRRLEEAGVKYVFSCWIDLFGLPTRPASEKKLERPPPGTKRGASGDL